MKRYESYMDRQTVSDALHQRLLALEQEREARPAAQPEGRGRRKVLLRRTALAVCCLLAVVLAGGLLFSARQDLAALLACAAAAIVLLVRSRPRWQSLAAMAACCLIAVGLGGWMLSQVRMGSNGAGADTAASAETMESVTEDAAPETPEMMDGGVMEEDALAGGGEIADSAAPDGASQESAEGAWDEPESVEDAEMDEPIGAERGPETALPAWLPEGYTLASTEREADGWYRVIWADGSGGEIWMEYGPETAARPEGVAVRDLASDTAADLTADDEGWYRFLVEEADGWRCYAANEDPEALWRVAQSLDG